MASTVGSPREMVDDLYVGVDNLQPDVFASHFAEDGQMTFGNAETVTGRAAIAAAITPILEMLERMKHNVVDAWRVEDTIFAQLSVDYIRKDGHSVTLPAATILRLDDGLIVDNRVYVDMAPLFQGPSV